MQRASKNIETIQKQVKRSVTNLLTENGYTFSTEDRFNHNEALLLQWTNKKCDHTFQLVWDIREKWFDLGEFSRTDNLNYLERTEIDLFPYSLIGVLYRARYNAKYVEKIEMKIKEKLSTTKPTLKRSLAKYVRSRQNKASRTNSKK
jgi:hypothetical protein